MDETNPIEIERVQLRTKLEILSEKATAVCERLKNETATAAKAVREHPYQATGIAFGLGILIGLLVSRSRRD